MTILATPQKLRYTDDSGAPLAGGKVYTYQAGTSTPLATYSDYDGLVANSNPIILDSRGEADVRMLDSQLYKFVVKDADDVTIYTVDDVGTLADTGLATVAAHATDSDFFIAGATQLTGSAVTFTNCAAAPAAGAIARVENTQANVWTDNSVFEMQGDQDFYAAAGDICWVFAKTTTTFRVFIEKASGYAPYTRASVNAKYISGMRVTNDGIDATNDIDIAAGSCRDSTDTVEIVQPSALVKQLDAGWAAGTDQGMRNSASGIANTTYHIYAVCKARGGSPDYYAHTSTTVATVLAALQAETGGSAYIYARRIFSIVRTGGAIYPFVQTGDRVMWVTSVQDVSGSANTSPTARTLTLPTGIKVEAVLGVSATATAANLTFVYDPDLGSLSAGSSSFNLYNEANVTAACQIRCMTNTSAQVNTDGNGANATVTISTQGFIDTRGRTE